MNTMGSGITGYGWSNFCKRSYLLRKIIGRIEYSEVRFLVLDYYYLLNIILP